MIHVLVTGAHSQLAQSLAYTQSSMQELQVEFVPKKALDITNQAQLRDFFGWYQIDYVINCAAYTQVDDAEREQTQAYAVNAYGPAYLAELAKKIGFVLWHISTDYVFDGSIAQPYKEDTPTNPLNYYGKTKLAGEQYVLASNPNSYIIRTSWLYKAAGNNFVTRFLAQAKRNKTINMVYDQIGCPTYADDLAQAIWNMLKQHYQAPEKYQPGIYHYAHEGVASRYDWAWAINYYGGLQGTLLPILKERFDWLADRPAYSVLSKEKIKQTFDLRIPHWQDGLVRCMQKLNKAS